MKVKTPTMSAMQGAARILSGDHFNQQCAVAELIDKADRLLKVVKVARQIRARMEFERRTSSQFLGAALLPELQEAVDLCDEQT